MVLTIGEVARRLGVSTSTLRYYESEGLLKAVERTSGGRRQFSQQDVEACRVIECLKRSGLSIKEIKDFMDMVAAGDASLAGRLELFRNRKESVQRELTELERVLAVLDFKIWYYEQAAEAGAENVVRSLPLEQIPERHRRAQSYLVGTDLNGPL
ncbi:MerR family transcriptional regulator [Actinomyces trachealis]|uniref:MerR family transcriptional regulator n=1 Tax=Actinomyces trachealis TaxID=2763540 RepID=UPI001892A08E|nr:MerR family transcriptional regulator [Actinomyces trachealis]